MSRLEFRASVEAPRPPSAWVMVGVGGATLWITGQLAPWAIGAQALALLASLRLRRSPRAWQRSAWVLNAAMLTVTACTVGLALRGHSAVVALAHFAALTQGLQLLDARPRRSEFLLVALALFQVTLAANLTDSVLFIPLVAAFVVSTTWTLMVHTLRTEALEAGTPGAVTAAITPGLLRTTFVASGAAFLLALALFVILPRMRAAMVQSGDLGVTLAMAGFSDQVRLGDLGRIRQDPSVVMRVETLEGRFPPADAAYWRGLAFDRFDGQRWSIVPSRRTPVAGVAEVGLDLARDRDAPNLVQRIVREPVTAGVLFAAPVARHVQGTIRRLERDGNGGLYAASQAEERIRYTVASDAPVWSDPLLAGDVARPPDPAGERYLQLPELQPSVATLAQRVSASARTDAERARTLETHLRRTGRYTDTPPPLSGSPSFSPVESFLLGEMAGHCEYFATAMVVLARSLGLPARLVNGFAGGRENRIGGFVEVTRSDAHAWVEVHFARAGWVRYDPTPPALRLRAVQPLSPLGRLRELGSAIELWWFQRVVDFDRSDQLRAMRSVWLAWRSLRGSTRAEIEHSREPTRPWRLPWQPRAVVPGLALLALGWLGLALRRRRGASSGISRPYARALRLLAGRGLHRAPNATARDFAARARDALSPPAAAAFVALTECHLQERFGGRPHPDALQQLSRLRAALRQGSPASSASSGDGGVAPR